MLLFAKLFGKSDFDSALANLCIIAFWGLARLLELTYSGNSGPLQYDSSILTTEFLYHRSAAETTIPLHSSPSSSTHTKHNTIKSRGTPANNNTNNQQKNGISKP
ncbi:hypothetical protein PGT21_005632 [Puccinia graminis f. sp. tritici]|uniref:Uncharacterized protein n=1 Tax=Puccinia graminis f. sp. tritici TaxID=56615 RepID=A0A5B0NBK1_PUCGR|nr:hypothetical protein PGT21_005632 [Puccinia graminis f. sp. tritici]